jgi:hypothetical protein
LSASLKQIAKRSKSCVIAYRIYDNWRTKKRFHAGNTESMHGSTHSRLSLAESLDYIERVFEDYLTYSELSPDAFKGKRILEVGPGDNFGVALKFLAAGAEQVVCLDKFYSKRDQGQQLGIYKALRERTQPESRERFDSAIKLDEEFILNPDKLPYVHGVGIEEAGGAFERGSFDFIISRAVIQDVYEIDAAFSAMDGLLADGGYMLHKIDFSDQGMFSSRGMNPLTFLTIPESVYRLMAVDSGKPNRRLSNYYRRKVDELDYDSKHFVARIYGRGDLVPHKEKIELNRDYTQATISMIEMIRPKLSAGFRDLTDEELAVSGGFLIARKGSRKTSDSDDKDKGRIRL